jgi:hypothetical protein
LSKFVDRDRTEKSRCSVYAPVFVTIGALAAFARVPCAEFSWRRLQRCCRARDQQGKSPRRPEVEAAQARQLPRDIEAHCRAAIRMLVAASRGVETAQEDVMKRSLGRVVGSTAAALLTVLSLHANAQVANGGFETGDFTGWLQTGDVSFSGVDSLAANAGSFGAFFGPTAVGGISQSFATLANTTYRVSFSLALQDSSQPNSFSWSWNGVTQTPVLTNAAGFGYTAFSSSVLATGGSSTLAFNFRDPQSFWLLDNVAVAAVPELPVNALIGAGLVLMAGAFRRRVSARAGS